VASTSTLQTLKEEVANALNDTADPPRQVEAADVSIYKRIEGRWQKLGNDEKAGKRVRETTLEELEIHGVGAGSVIDDEGEVLGYTITNGIEGEEQMEIEAYPRDE
jgi:hypothetical protein